MKIEKKTICPLDCPDSCGMIATVEDGRVTSLRGDPDHPFTRGVICRKMRAYPERVYAAERILYPMARVGAKGAARFERISWDQAWDRLCSRLGEIIDSHGGTSILPYCYAGNMGHVSRFAGFPLFHRIGTSRLEQTICSATAAAGWRTICGDVGGTPPERVEEADLIVIWGLNAAVSNLHFWGLVQRARKRGARLVVIDPYKNATARSADLHIWVKPGGDTALALGVLKLLTEQNRIDERFINECSSGFDQLKAYLENTAFESFAQHSNVSRQTMAELADMLADTNRAFVRIGVGLTRNSRGASAVRAIGSLAAASGCFNGEPGQGVLLFAGAFSGDSSILKLPELGSGETRAINMIHLGEALNSLEPPIKAILVYNSNPFSVAPDGSMVRKGLLREDLFTVVHEQVMTPTARYADLLLPATTFLENRDLYTAYGHFYFGVTEPVIEPVGESISNFDLFQQLAKKMGYHDPAFSESAEERLKNYFNSIPERPEKIDFERYTAGTFLLSEKSSSEGCAFDGEQRVFRFVDTADPGTLSHPVLSGGIEFDSPDLTARFPLRLITPPNDKLLNSTFGERYVGETGPVLIHPDDAASRHIIDGAIVRLHNLRGTIRRRARISADTQPGLVVAEGIYWPAEDGEGGINDLTSQQCSDLGGGAIFHESRVDISADEGVKGTS